MHEEEKRAGIPTTTVGKSFGRKFPGVVYCASCGRDAIRAEACQSLSVRFPSSSAQVSNADLTVQGLLNEFSRREAKIRLDKQFEAPKVLILMLDRTRA